MADSAAPRRLTDLLPVKAAACLLVVLWVAGMSVFDTNACTSFPLVAGLGAVAVLVLSGLSYGGKSVRLSWVNWLSFGVGGYFLARCLNSYAVVESWRESILIIAGFVFYLAGIYAAQSRSLRLLGTVLLSALVLNIGAFFALRTGEIPIEWTGRPEWGFSGKNSMPVTLFMYKNFSGDFLCIGGLCAVGMAVWGKGGIVSKAVYALTGCIAVALSFCCGTRGVFVLLPVLAIAAWVLMFVNSLFSPGKKAVFLGGSGGVLLLVLAFVAYEFLNSGAAYSRLMETDTHLRSMIWRGISDEAPNAPLWGYGVSASHWDILTHFNEWATPNYAHNEYLQAWMDYGLLGACGMLGIVAVHFIAAFRRLSEDALPPSLRCLVSLSVLVLLGWVVCSIADFPWHHLAPVGMTAFACGVMASPYPRAVSRGGQEVLEPVRVQGMWGRGCVALLCCGVLGYAAWMGCRLYEPWVMQWEYSKLLKTQPENEMPRLALLETVTETYPDPAVMDQYYLLPLQHHDWEKQEKLLKRVLAANPHQLYTATMLADVLTRQGKYEESELTMRRYFPGDGLSRSLMMNWPGFYVTNLLAWGKTELKRGNTEKAYSLMNYGLNIVSHREFSLGLSLAYRSNAPWCRKSSYRADVRKLQQKCEQDCTFIRRCGLTGDDSWMQPTAQCNKSALYAKWGLDSSHRKKIKLKTLKMPKKTEKKANK